MSDVGKLVFTAAIMMGLAWLIRSSWANSLVWIEQRGEVLSLADWQRQTWRGLTWLVGPLSPMIFSLFVTQNGSQEKIVWKDERTGGYNEPTYQGDRTLPPESDLCLAVIETSAAKGPKIGTCYPLQEGVHAVGRKPTREPRVELITIPGDEAVSRDHLYLEIQDDGTFQVEDRGSAYGTRLNGRRLASGEKATVKSGDKLRLGNTTLQLAGQNDRQPSGVKPPPPTWQLVIVNGQAAGQTRPLGQKPLVIGRHPECDWQLADNRISRQHAEVRREGNQVHIFDRNSTHGLYVNGHKFDSRTLEPGDIIKLGNTELRFEKVTN